MAQSAAMMRLDSSRDGERGWALAPTVADSVLRCDARTGVTKLGDGAGARGAEPSELRGARTASAKADPTASSLPTPHSPRPTSNSGVDPLTALASLAKQDGRWVGYLSYDLGRLFEKIPSIAGDDLGLPLFAFSRCGDGPAAEEPAGIGPDARPGGIRSNFTAVEYQAAVARVIEYIRAGDIFQVNLSQRLTIESAASVSWIYERLRRLTPATYGALLDFGDFALIGNSPELFFRVTRLPDGRRKIVTRPIKGTRPRLEGMDIALCDSVKDQAELNMIVDLERNDLGRICQIGTVEVTEPRTIEAHPTVWHGVATIEGILRDDVGFVDILRAMFPGGSVTGAPKIRAMEIIEELEPVRRGPYCGAVGYIDADGSMEFNIAIRTMIAKDGQIHIPVGGGIVADSDPAGEYEETLVKARAMLAAVGVSGERVA